MRAHPGGGNRKRRRIPTAILLDLHRTSVSNHIVCLNYLVHYKHLSAAKKGLELQVVHIYFDTSTFDRVERDVKVSLIK